MIPTHEELIADIHANFAANAFRGTSMVPETRGAGVIKEYADQVHEDLSKIEAAAFASSEVGARGRFVEWAIQYRTGYRLRFTQWLAARAKIKLSPTGEAATATAAKAEKIASRKWAEAVVYRAKQLKIGFDVVMNGEHLIDTNHALVVEVPSVDRIRVVFEKNVSASLRRQLSSAGFRYSEILECWSARITPESKRLAQSLPKRKD